MGVGFWIGMALLAVLVFGVLPFAGLCGMLYSILLVRTKPDKWGRVCSFPEDEEYLQMFNEGIEWGKRYESFKQPVDIVSDGFHLFGEYFDFGADKAVIIIPGRTESCLYSYYFSEPYREAGYNVLVIDNRCHGLSEGKYCSLGFKEYRDILNWGRLLHDEFHNESVILHGVCIGASTALFALTSPDCPDYMAGMVSEGMYTTFGDSFDNHLREDGHHLFPVSPIVKAYIRIFGGADVAHDGPVRRIGLLHKPVLFIHSKKDVFSLPQKSEVMYNNCVAPKQISWFEKGAHSRVRVNAPEKYDRVIIDFLQNTDIWNQPRTVE